MTARANECFFRHEQEKLGPCWGEDEAVDEQPLGDDDSMWFYACEGHYAMYPDADPKKYKPEPSR